MDYDDWHRLERHAYLWAMVAEQLLNQPEQAAQLREHAEDFGQRAVAAEMKYERTRYGLPAQCDCADQRD